MKNPQDSAGGGVRPLERVAVYCGSSMGVKNVYREQARHLGLALGAQGLGLVYGGASVGLMGTVADAVLESGGEVVGVLPRFLDSREVAHHGLSRFVLVETMHERKQLMAEMADAFIALPGGYGTLEELAEVLTWAQLALHHKPVGILNVDGFYDPLLALLERMTQDGFMRPAHRQLLHCAPTAEELLDELRSNAQAAASLVSKLDCARND